MMPDRHNQRSGLTSTDLTWVFALLVIGALVIASMLTPKTSVSRPRSKAMGCLSQARVIAGAMRAYASNWDGWTNPDPCYYVKEFGYKLSSESGYHDEDPPWYVPGAANPTRSQRRAESIREFRCPLDKRPILHAHGIPTSYQVCAPFTGYNIMDSRMNLNRVLAVAEVGERHPLRGRPGGGERHPLRDKPLAGCYVYADLSTTLGYWPYPR